MEERGEAGGRGRATRTEGKYEEERERRGSSRESAENTDRASLFLFGGVYVCRFVFAHSRAKEANTSVIRTMRAQKKGLSLVGQAGERGKQKVDKERATRNVVGVTKMAEEEVDAAFLLICEISLLSLSLCCSRSTFSPFSRLVTLPVPPVCKFAVHRNARVLVPSFSIDLR